MAGITSERGPRRVPGLRTVLQYLGLFADDGADFRESGLMIGLGPPHHHRLAVEPEVGTDRAGSEMRPVAEHGIADVVEMRRLHPVEEQAMFEFAAVAQNTVRPGDEVAANHRPRPDNGFRSDPGRAEDGGIGRQLDRRMQVDRPLDVDAIRDVRSQVRQLQSPGRSRLENARKQGPIRFAPATPPAGPDRLGEKRKSARATVARWREVETKSRPHCWTGKLAKAMPWEKHSGARCSNLGGTHRRVLNWIQIVIQ